MSSDVDLRGLAIDRGGTDGGELRPRRQILSRYVLPLVLLAGFLLLVGWASWDLMIPPQVVTVVPVFATTAEVRQEGTPLFRAAGWIEPRPTPVRAAALAPGVVEELLVVEDQPVTAGQPVAELVKDDAELAHDRAVANLELRQAELEATKAALLAARTRFEQPVHLQAALGEAEASLAKIETQLKNLPFAIRRAEADHEAMQRDYEGKVTTGGVVAGVEIDIARSKAEASQALVEELQTRAASLRKEQAAMAQRRDALGTQLDLLADEIQARDESEAKLKAANARCSQARVAVAEAKLRLDRMTVVAPTDGRVYRLIAHPGARIGSGMTQMDGHDGSTVVTLYRPNMLQVRVDVRFEDIPKVNLNQPVAIDNPALPSPLTGKVLFVSSEADIQKNTLQVKIEIPDPPTVFKPEMLVDVTFLAPPQIGEVGEPSTEIRIYVPRQLIDQGEGGPYVWLADQSEGVVRKKKIATGTPGADGLVEVVDGLTASSRLVSSHSDRLQDGDRIEVTGEGPALGTNAMGGSSSERLRQGNSR